jgi:hypothetical protein
VHRGLPVVGQSEINSLRVPSFLYDEGRRIIMNGYAGTISPDTPGIWDGRHIWGEHGVDSVLIMTRTITFPGESESDREIHAVNEAVRLAQAFVAFHKA